MADYTKIRTIDELVEVATEENLDNLMIDLKEFLRLCLNQQALFAAGLAMDTGLFEWKDDGKHEHTLIVRLPEKGGDTDEQKIRDEGPAGESND